MECKNCRKKAIKNGSQKDGTQRYYCKRCQISFQGYYINKACESGINHWIKILVLEGCGTSSISRLLKISPITVTSKIIAIASKTQRPPILFGQEYEVDEMYTYIGNKEH